MGDRWSEKERESRRKARKKYCNEFVIYKSVALNKNTDSDIIEHLKSIGSFSGYVHELIRKDMEKEKAPC